MSLSPKHKPRRPVRRSAGRAVVQRGDVQQSLVQHSGNISKLFERAVQRREKLIQTQQALRLFDGVGDGVPGVLIDRYGPALLVHLYPEQFAGSKIAELRQQLLQFASAQVASGRAISAVYAKSHTAAGKAVVSIWCGTSLGRYPISEGRLSLLVQPDSQLNAGLFLDMRELRERLSVSCKGLRVLNTFCFTGSLGLAAALGGAEEVVQLDASRSALNWARANHERNASAAALRFVCEDSISFLERERRRQQRYDMILLDPPAFGRAGTKRFSLRQDAAQLLTCAMQLVAAKGLLLFSVNLQSFSHDHLRRFAQQAAAASGRRIAEIQDLFPPPIEFPSRPQESHAMRGLWIRVE
jgi:23S rRNA (cytosine1962-C5)-methyltransferase